MLLYYDGLSYVRVKHLSLEHFRLSLLPRARQIYKRLLVRPSMLVVPEVRNSVIPIHRSYYIRAIATSHVYIYVYRNLYQKFLPCQLMSPQVWRYALSNLPCTKESELHHCQGMAVL